MISRSNAQPMPAPSDRRHAAVYARVSTDDQGKGFSIPTQIEACRKLAEVVGTHSTRKPLARTAMAWSKNIRVL